jgi:tetratricopeptide (TPR) repeat protein
MMGDQLSEGHALGNLGLAYARLGNPGQAKICYEQRLAIVRALGDCRGEANGLGNRGIAYHSEGNLETAARYYKQQLVLARAIGDQQGKANASWNMGRALELSDPKRAATLMQILADYEASIAHPAASQHATQVADVHARVASDCQATTHNMP